MASAGLVRGGFGDRISHRLNWYHAVSQGALGVECRSDDAHMITQILAPLVDRKALLECLAERVLMKALEGGCSVPIGVRTKWTSPSPSSNKTELTLEAIVLSLDGTQRVEASATQPLDEQLPEDAAIDAFSRLSDFTDVPVRHFEKHFQVQLCNSVLLGRRLSKQMIDLSVKDILAAITRQKQL